MRPMHRGTTRRPYNAGARPAKAAPYPKADTVAAGTVLWVIRFDGEEEVWHTSAASALKMYLPYEEDDKVSLWQKYRGNLSRIS